MPHHAVKPQVILHIADALCGRLPDHAFCPYPCLQCGWTLRGLSTMCSGGSSTPGWPAGSMSSSLRVGQCPRGLWAWGLLGGLHSTTLVWKHVAAAQNQPYLSGCLRPPPLPKPRLCCPMRTGHALHNKKNYNKRVVDVVVPWLLKDCGVKVRSCISCSCSRGHLHALHFPCTDVCTHLCQQGAGWEGGALRCGM